jgi:hypothetical protein
LAAARENRLLIAAIGQIGPLLADIVRRHRRRGSAPAVADIGQNRGDLRVVELPKADEFEALDLYHATTGGEAALARKHRDDAIRGRTAAHDEAPIVPAAQVPVEAAE